MAAARVAVALAAVAVAASAARAQARGSIRGTVVDQSGRPVDGAQVAVTPGARHAISGDDGAFEVRELWSGRYEISVRRIGYQPAAVSVNVHDTVAVVRVALVAIPRQLDSVRIREKASGLLFDAVVLDQHGQPVTGADVVAEGISNTIVTDSLGRFRVPRLARGTLMLRMRKMGYQAFFDSYRVVTDRADTLRMRSLAETLSPVEVKERSGYGMDYWAYRDLDQRTRWKSSAAGAVSREELAPQGRLNLCDALPRTPSGNRYVFIPPYACPRSYFRMLIDGSRCQQGKLTDFAAEDVEAVEYYPRGRDWSGNLAARCPGAVFVIWLRHEAGGSP